MKIKVYSVITPRGRTLSYGKLAIDAIRSGMEEIYGGHWAMSFEEAREEWREYRRKGYKCVRLELKATP